MQVEANTDEYDKEFIALITGNCYHMYIRVYVYIDIEKRIKHLTKHDRLRVESWVTFNYYVCYNDVYIYICIVQETMSSYK